MPTRHRLVRGGCAFLLLLAFVLIHPRAEIGINDDWSFIFSAKRLAETGHVLYNGWAAPILGVQLYLGALFIRLFGFSLFAARASSMGLALLSSCIAYDVMTRCGIRSRNAAFGTLTLTLSPLYLPLATTYMSDSFAMFFILLFFYAGVRCEQAGTQRATLLWLAVATVAGLAGGSVRQIAFLCNLVALPGLVWRLRRRSGVPAVGVTLWLAALAVTFWLVHWFNSQPYTSIERLFYIPDQPGELLGRWLPQIGKSVAECLLLLLPVLAAIALKFPARQGKRLWLLLLLTGLLAVGVELASIHHAVTWWGTLLIGNYASTWGVIWHLLGAQNPVLPAKVQIALAFLLILTTLVAAWTVLLTNKQRSAGPLAALDRTVLWMAIPFTGGYLLLVFTRLFVFDRYFLPILFLAILLAMRWFERRFAQAAGWLTLVPLIALAFYGVATTHDRFASARAQVAATAELRAAGVPRTAIDADFEYNGWTQLESTGYVNEPRIHPADAYHPFAIPAALSSLHPAAGGDGACSSFFYTYTPSIHARYILQRTSSYCFPDSTFPPIRYRTWLRPYNNALYIAEIPPRYR